MTEREILIKALRCSSSVPVKDHTCEGCRYRCLEEIDPEIAVKADCTIDGISYWEGCDCDQIMIDAAQYLEHLA